MYAFKYLEENGMDHSYQRRSPLIIQYIRSCMDFYKLEATRRGGIPCSIDNVRLDEMLIFRVIS